MSLRQNLLLLIKDALCIRKPFTCFFTFSTLQAAFALCQLYVEGMNDAEKAKPVAEEVLHYQQKG